MPVRQFSYSIDNLGYLLIAGCRAMAIDGGAVDAVMAAVEQCGVRLEWVASTHGHVDHTTGCRQLAERARARYLDFDELLARRRWLLDGVPVEVLATPGHTSDSVTFSFERCLITGDTLFNGTVGNCFSGDLRAFHRSLQRLLEFADDTIVYAGHDYVRTSMKIALDLEPGNRAAIDAYLAAYNARHVCSTIGSEKTVNPYLRYNEPELVALMHARGLPVDTERQRFESVMTLG